MLYHMHLVLLDWCTALRTICYFLVTWAQEAYKLLLVFLLLFDLLSFDRYLELSLCDDLQVTDELLFLLRI